jgi:hypothetical protein
MAPAWLTMPGPSDRRVMAQYAAEPIATPHRVATIATEMVERT